MSTTVEQVKQCRTPQEALLVLASVLDHVTARVHEIEKQPGGDLWEQPLTWDDGEPFTIKSLEVNDSLELRGVKNILEGITTPDNRSRIVNGDVVVNEVSQARQIARGEFVRNARLSEFYGPSLSAFEFENAYVKGGPRWLYYDSREVVMSMPLNYREALVADVLLDSASEADEIGRDILKFDESVPQGSQEEFLRRDLGPLG